MHNSLFFSSSKHFLPRMAREVPSSEIDPAFQNLLGSFLRFIAALFLVFSSIFTFDFPCFLVTLFAAMGSFP